MMITDISPSKHPSTSDPNLSHLPHSPSPISLVHSEGDTPLYAPSLVQDSSVVDLPSQSDIIIAYVDPTFKLCIQNSKYCSVMGQSGAGKTAVSFLRFNSSQSHSMIHLRSLSIKLLELKRLKSPMVWNLVLVKFKLSVASTRSKIVR